MLVTTALYLTSSVCLQGIFSRWIIFSNPDNIKKIYTVDWEDRPGNPDLIYRSQEHWQAVTVSYHHALLSNQ